MATEVKKMTPAQIQDLYRKAKPLARKEAQPQYTLWQLFLESCNITAYTSGKVVFAGKDVSEFVSPSKKKPAAEPISLLPEVPVTYPMAGSDEVGVGDYFGPMVVAACIVETQEIADQLENLGVQDSKALSDEQMRKMAPAIKALCPHSICVLKNIKYNQQHERYNINALKAILHNQVYLNLQAKGHILPELRVVDQFVPEKGYYKHLQDRPEVVKGLTFETKAENKYVAVAAASILARAAFLDAWDAMEEAYDFTFEKGANSGTDECAALFLHEYGMSELPKVAKVHFANTKKAQEIWKKKYPLEASD